MAMTPCIDEEIRSLMETSDKLDIIETLKRFTWNDILTCKDIELHEISKNFDSLEKAKPIEENNGMECGNKIIYNYLTFEPSMLPFGVTAALCCGHRHRVGQGHGAVQIGP